MSFCEAARRSPVRRPGVRTSRSPLASLVRAGALVAVMGLAACQSGPLHGGGPADPLSGQPAAGLQSLAGRIAVVEPNSRTEQVVRNPLLFALNGAEAVRDPLYEIALVTTPVNTAVSIQGGSGVPTASLYQLRGAYTLTRLSDRQVIAQGNRLVTAPYDRSEQLFAAQRALIDAREQAGQTLARQIALALSPALREEARTGGTTAPLAAR